MPVSGVSREKISRLTSKASDIGAQMVRSNVLENMFSLVEKFIDDPQLFEEFKKDPQSVVDRELGKDFSVPDTHYHTADENNNYIPEEAGAAEQIMKASAKSDTVWARIEVRAGIGPRCFFNCGVCKEL